MSGVPLRYRAARIVRTSAPLTSRIGTPRSTGIPAAVVWEADHVRCHPMALRVLGPVRRTLPLAMRIAGTPPFLASLGYRVAAAVRHSHPLAVQWQGRAAWPFTALVVSRTVLERLPVALQFERGQTVTLTAEAPVTLDPLPE